MRALTASEELRIWEIGNRQTLAARSLMLLAAALPNSPAGDLARLPIGRRDTLLLSLRELMFGSRIDGIAACPKCEERLDLMFDVAEIRAETDSDISEIASQHVLKLNGFEVTFRPPDSTDLEAIAGCPDADSGREKLLERCALQVVREGLGSEEALSVEELPATVVTALVKKLDDVDPQANVKLSLVCPACQHTWEAVFDIASFFWGEITDWAKRMLRQVHVLASSYGWSERDILEMSAERRTHYVQMIEGA
jgi:uncharacterized protein (UPF0212 family)